MVTRYGFCLDRFDRVGDVLRFFPNTREQIVFADGRLRQVLQDDMFNQGVNVGDSELSSFFSAYTPVSAANPQRL